MLSQGRALGGDVAGVVVGSGVRELAAQAGELRRGDRLRRRRPALEAPLPQPRVDVLAPLVREQGLRHRAVRRVGARRRRRRRPRGPARRRAELGPRRPRARGRHARRQAAGARRLGARRRRAGSPTPRLGARPLRHLRPRARPAAAPEVEEVAVELRGLLDRRARWSSRRTRSDGPSIEDADVIVAGGRGLGGPRASSSSRSSRRRSAARSRATRAVVDAGWYPYADAGRPDRQDRLAEALHRLRHLRRDPAQGRHAGLGHDRRDQQGPERADLRVRRPRRRRRPAPDRPEADRARPARGRARDRARRVPAAVRAPR